jgi:hypothetical protein
MKTVRSFFVFLFVFLVSTSILLDWSDYAHTIAYKTHGTSILDKYEEICTQKGSLTYELKVHHSVAVNYHPASYSESNTLTFITSNVSLKNINYFCKVKSYLHLLQLF